MPPIKNTVKETFKDIPTPKEIKKAILHSRTKMKALITFIASTGLRRADVAKLTVQDFIEATKEYHNERDITRVIYALDNQDDIIPLWNITDIKTNYNHISLSSPESTQYILQMLKERNIKEEIKPEETLFKIKAGSISKNFRVLNNRLKLGQKETRVRFHPHSLRKYFATTLTANDMPYLDVQFLLGHALKQVDSSYFFVNADKLKQRYKRILPVVTFTIDIAYVELNNKERRELKELKQFKVESAKRINQLEEMINLLKNEI